MKRDYILIFSLLLLLSFSGCRQPVGQPGARTSAFDFGRTGLFNGGGLFGRSDDTRMASNNLFGNTPGIGGGVFSRGNYSVDGFGNPVGPGVGSGTRVAGNPVQYDRRRGDAEGLDGLSIDTGSPGEYNAYSRLASEYNQLNRRVGSYDQDNQQLYAEVASLKQKLQLANDYNFQLKQQLADTTGQINQMQANQVTAERRLAQQDIEIQRLAQLGGGNSGFSGTTGQSSTSGQQVGFSEVRGQTTPTQLAGATIRANNSLMSRLNEIQIPGGQARMDGDLIRIEFPSDQLFVPGTYEIQPAQAPVFQNLVATIRQSFPRQIVGIEAHWDNTPLNPPTTTHHQLTATQALAVFNNMVRLGLSPNQLFTMGMGSNRPRHPGGLRGNPNRRVELVIYPETFDGS
ncbi:MAG: OmpA family protein [Planctomycetota bacterium]